MLRERILSGDLGPGERLQQIPLSETLGVSTPTVVRDRRFAETWLRQYLKQA